MNNKKLGNKFERELCLLLAENGFWAYNCATKTSGQPADIIAARNGRAFLIDAKECTNDLFDTTRIEENQKNSMLLWGHTGNGIGYFALKISDGAIYMVDFVTMMAARACKRTLNRSDIVGSGCPIDSWVAQQ